MLDLMEALVSTRLPLGLHNEDQEIVLSRIAQAKAAGRDGIAAHVEARPEAAELAATGQFLALGLAIGAHVHPVHLTTEAGFRLTGAIAESSAPRQPANFASITSGSMPRVMAKGLARA
ncbi:hypothetical protein LZK73_31270 (plasmid) [Neorhizobium galegae]|nr:hypothetical protein LZK73_31270 [Neorhizobium galegae]